MDMKSIVRPALLVAVVALLSASIRAEVIEQVLVKVNGDIITKTELEQRLTAAVRQSLNGRDPASLTPEERTKLVANATPEVLVGTVDELLLLQRGRELGLHLGDEQFRQVVNNIRKEQGLQDEEKFQAALKQENMTMDDLRKQLERQMLIEQVQRQEVGSKLTITEAESRLYYDRHPQEFTEPASITLRELFVQVASDPKQPNAVSVEKDDEARKKIDALRARLVKGEDFATVASEASDSSSKANGGLIGPFNRNDLSPQLLQLIDKLKVGEFTEAVRTPRGYQVFKVEAVKPAALQPFDKVRDLIADKVAAARTRTEMRKFLTRLRSQAIIEWKNEELKKSYEKQLAADETASSGQ
jgi:peptidyl-prolyl cis-trans isomerase SurA